jgi:16S rRNA (cytosine967-C5)-methyltransferase
MVERWLDRWGFAETERLLEANNLRPELYLSPVGTGVEESVRLLSAMEIEAHPVDFAPRSVRVMGGGEVAPILAALPSVVQDPAAGLVVDYAAVPSGATVLDLCSAPGGKAVGLSGSAGYLIAGDISVGRLGRVRQNVRRLGLAERVGMVVADARHPPFAEVDMVVLDAPCTGTGALRRHPDGRWRVGPNELRELMELQRELLDAAADLVRRGGVLVYATCSLEPEENAEQVAGFLTRHPEFERAPVDGSVKPELLTTDGSLLVLPQIQHVDGAFAARLRRIG